MLFFSDNQEYTLL